MEFHLVFIHNRHLSVQTDGLGAICRKLVAWETTELLTVLIYYNGVVAGGNFIGSIVAHCELQVSHVASLNLFGSG